MLRRIVEIDGNSVERVEMRMRLAYCLIAMHVDNARGCLRVLIHRPKRRVERCLSIITNNLAQEGIADILSFFPPITSSFSSMILS